MEEYTQISEPGDGTIHELNTVSEVLSFLNGKENVIQLTDKEAELLLGYLEGHDYMLGELNGELLMGDLAEMDEGILWSDTSMDDVIDKACEWNYELILATEAEKFHAESDVAYAERETYYQALKADEMMLDRLFDRTHFAREIEVIAENLADQFIAALKPDESNTKNPEKEVAAENQILNQNRILNQADMEQKAEEIAATVVEAVRSYGSGGRGR